MRTMFADTVGGEDNDTVGMTDRCQAMGYDQGRAVT